MAVTPKPKPKPKNPDTEAEELIRRGGSVAGERKQSKPSSVILRIPPDILDRIDAALTARPFKVPRHQWLLEAITEKLDRESG